MPGKTARSDPRPSVRVTRGAGSGQHLASLLQEGRENANIDAGLGFIWRISVHADQYAMGNRSSAFIIKSHLREFYANVRSRRAQISLQRREAIKAMWLLERAKLPDTGEVDVLGYKIAYLGEQPFRAMFDEIFMEECYHFDAGTDRPTIFDCGSNIGMSVLYFKKHYPFARILAFEPDPRTFATLCKNTHQNQLDNVETHQAALGLADDVVDFYRPENENLSGTLMSTNPKRWHPKRIQVPAKRLSTFIDSEVDLLKLDVEGAELDVMDDLIATGKLHHVRRIQLEYHHHIGSARDKLSLMLRWLEEAGFGYLVRAHPGPRLVARFNQFERI
jgi:FkbM family methyltransferase